MGVSGEESMANGNGADRRLVEVTQKTHDAVRALLEVTTAQTAEARSLRTEVERLRGLVEGDRGSNGLRLGHVRLSEQMAGLREDVAALKRAGPDTRRDTAMWIAVGISVISLAVALASGGLG